MKMVYNPRCWVRCIDCGRRQLVRRSRLDRRSRLRCDRCGGMIEVSVAASDDMVEGRARLDRERQRAIEQTRRKP